MRLRRMNGQAVNGRRDVRVGQKRGLGQAMGVPCSGCPKIKRTAWTASRWVRAVDGYASDDDDDSDDEAAVDDGGEGGGEGEGRGEKEGKTSVVEEGGDLQFSGTQNRQFRQSQIFGRQRSKRGPLPPLGLQHQLIDISHDTLVQYYQRSSSSRPKVVVSASRKITRRGETQIIAEANSLQVVF